MAIVGARAASAYGLEVARSLARGLGAGGVTVVSGMALGIDSAAHRGALSRRRRARSRCCPPGPTGRIRPRRGRCTAGSASAGAVVSELPPGTAVRRWMFPARNRIIAALSAMTVVVEGRPESGALLTAGWARRLGRPVGAVPGRVTSPLAAGPHELLRGGARAGRAARRTCSTDCSGSGVRPMPRPRGSALAPDLERAARRRWPRATSPRRRSRCAGLDADARAGGAGLARARRPDPARGGRALLGAPVSRDATRHH